MRTPAKSSDRTELIELGYVSGIFGFQGEVRLFLYNRDSDFLRKPRAVVLRSPSGEERHVELRSRSGAGGRVIGRLNTVKSREEAASLKDWKIVVPLADLPPPEADEYYVSMLVGAAVWEADQPVGEVSQVHSAGPADVLEVRLTDGGQAFVPLLGTHVLEIDRQERVITVAPGALATAE